MKGNNILRFSIVTQIFFILLFLPNICMGGYILKVKNNKILATLGDLDSDFVTKGDLFSIENKEGHVVGRAKILKFNSNKVVLKFVGKAQEGYEIFLKNYAVPTNTSLDNSKRQPANTSYDNYNLNNNEYKKVTNISTGQYITGGILGTLMGVGIGHAIQERYKENGWIFTVSQCLSAVSFGYYLNQRNGVGANLSILTLLGFRIWELIDVWWLPSSHKTALYRKENNFYITPFLYSYNHVLPEGFGLSFVFKY